MELKELRQQLHLTLEGMARDLHISKSAISKYENGVDYMTDRVRLLIYETYGVHVTDPIPERIKQKEKIKALENEIATLKKELYLSELYKKNITKSLNNTVRECQKLLGMVK